MITATSKIDPAIRELAKQWVEESAPYDPDLRKAYLFPADDEMRMLYVDATAPPVREGDEIAPFYFKANPKLGYPFATASAVIRPEEAEVLPAPRGWGDWSQAEVIWENEREHPEDDQTDVPLRQRSPSVGPGAVKQNINPAIREAALRQIEDNVLYDPELRKVYLFPSEDQMRILYVEANNPPIREGDETAPFYFNAHPEHGTFYATATTKIRPEEAEKLLPPSGWADWSEAEILWEDERENAP